MGDDSRKVSAVEWVHAPSADFHHDDWNQLYDIVAHEYFVPMDSRIPGIGGKCYWPRWVILSRKLKMAQPSWYDVQKNTDPKDSNDIQPSASLSLAASLVSSTPPLKTTPSTFRRQSRRSITEEKNRRPSRSVKNLVHSYAESPDEAEIVTIEGDDDKKEFPPAKRLRGDTLIHNKVSMDTRPNPNHDYVLRFPPRLEGVGMCVYKEGNLTCFARLLRPADFGNNSPPDVGDSVETIDGEVVGERGYDYIRQILANNGGKSVCLVGFRRKCDPAITKRVSENEYDLHLPVTERGLGIRINAKKEKEGPVYLEKFFRILDADSEVTPKVEEGGDVIVGIDGVDAAALGYKAVKDLFTNHEGRSERIIRLRKNLVTEGSTPATINGENGTTQRASGINGTLQGTVQMAGAKLNGHPSGEYGPAQPAIVPEFDVKVRMTQKGPGIVVSQSGGNAVFEQFHDFAQLMGSPSPVRGDEIVAIDGITVHDFQYQRVIETLKNAQDGQWRTIRFRSKLH